jgi:type II secretory pathway component GspD/PulD (secretin)
MSRRAFAVLIVTAALASVGSVSGMEPQWPVGPYKYMVIDQDIKGVLTEFGRNVGVPVDVSDQVKGRLRGRLAVAPAREFLDRLCESYGLVWYFDGAVLHVSAKTEIRTELVSIGRLSPAEVSEKLNGLGIADARFPVRSTPDTGVISVSGPPPFVSLVRQTLIVLAPPPRVREDSHGDEIRVRVFRGGAITAPPDISLAGRATAKAF